MTELDQDTALEETRPGVFEGALTDRWFIGAGLNGGYIATVLTRALMSSATKPHPLTATTHFMARAVPGPVTVTVQSLTTGRSHETLTATLEQADTGAVAFTVATFGQRRPDQPELLRISPPSLVRPDEPPAPQGFPGMTFIDRFSFHVDRTMAEWTDGTVRDPVFTSWVRLKDRSVDSLSIPLFADCLPPPLFAHFNGGLAPTIELTVHWRDEPAGDWLLCRFESRYLSGGYVEEDGELWSDDGRLVAQSRQISRFTPPA